jgi:hypothetical protein
MIVTQVYQPSSSLKTYWGTCHYIAQNNFRVLAGGDWVSLFAPPSEYAYDEALLLCEVDEERWIAWIPNHGEAQLCLRQFCPLVT